VAAELVGRRIVGARQPAIELVDEAEVALEVPDERDAAVIEMREVDAGAENAPSPVLGMLHRTAAQHRHFASRVEQGEVDADLCGPSVVFGSAALGRRGFFGVTGGAWPRRSTDAPASSTMPLRETSGNMASASGRGSSMA